LIEPENPEIPINRQCDLLGLSRSTYYYTPRPVDRFNELLMKLIDEQYTRTPFYGVPRITKWLRKQGYAINRKRVGRLMKSLGLQAVHPKPRLSQGNKEHKIYPYLLRNLSIDRPDHVWAADITYIRMFRGFVYLIAIMDWFSRYVLVWKLSITLEKNFCVRALENALTKSKPEIFNTDQGSQFTSNDFTGCLEKSKIAISMDGRGRVFDNIFIERLWRTVKYEEVYLKDYHTVSEAQAGLERYFDFYNTERFHSSLGDRTPYEVYFKERYQNNAMEDTTPDAPYTPLIFV